MNNSFLNILFNEDLSPEDKIALLQKEALESTLDESLDSDTYERATAKQQPCLHGHMLHAERDLSKSHFHHPLR